MTNTTDDHGARPPHPWGCPASGPGNPPPPGSSRWSADRMLTVPAQLAFYSPILRLPSTFGSSRQSSLDGGKLRRGGTKSG